MDGVEERIIAVEMVKAPVTGKGVALGFTAVNQEVGFIIKPNTAIDTNTIFVIFHIFFIRFAIFQLTQKHKEETFVTIVIATGIAAVDTGVGSVVMWLFVIVVGSIVKPHRGHHFGIRSHFFVRSSCLLSGQ